MMKRALFPVFLLLALPLSAQTIAPTQEGWSIAAYGGGAAFTAFQNGSFQSIAESPTQGSHEREFSRRVGAKTTGTFAGTIGYWPSPRWGLRLFVAYAPTEFETLVPQHEAELMLDQRDVPESGPLAALAITSYEAQGMLRLPTIRKKLMPYALLGVGAVRYSARQGEVPLEAQRDFAGGSRIEPAIRFGVGARLPMRPAGLGLNFELSDQISQTPVRGDGGNDVRRTNAVSFIVGLSWTLSPR